MFTNIYATICTLQTSLQDHKQDTIKISNLQGN